MPLLSRKSSLTRRCGLRAESVLKPCFQGYLGQGRACSHRCGQNVIVKLHSPQMAIVKALVVTKGLDIFFDETFWWRVGHDIYFFVLHLATSLLSSVNTWSNISIVGPPPVFRCAQWPPHWTNFSLKIEYDTQFIHDVATNHHSLNLWVITVDWTIMMPTLVTSPLTVWNLVVGCSLLMPELRISLHSLLIYDAERRTAVK